MLTCLLLLYATHTYQYILYIVVFDSKQVHDVVHCKIDLVAIVDLHQYRVSYSLLRGLVNIAHEKSTADILFGIIYG